jgi:hypothetical protein
MFIPKGKSAQLFDLPLKDISRENQPNLIGAPVTASLRSPMEDSFPVPFTGAEHGSPPARILVIGVILTLFS